MPKWTPLLLIGRGMVDVLDLFNTDRLGWDRRGVMAAGIRTGQNGEFLTDLKRVGAPCGVDREPPRKRRPSGHDGETESGPPTDRNTLREAASPFDVIAGQRHTFSADTSGRPRTCEGKNPSRLRHRSSHTHRVRPRYDGKHVPELDIDDRRRGRSCSHCKGAASRVKAITRKPRQFRDEPTPMKAGMAIARAPQTSLPIPRPNKAFGRWNPTCRWAFWVG